MTPLEDTGQLTMLVPRVASRNLVRSIALCGRNGKSTGDARPRHLYSKLTTYSADCDQFFLRLDVKYESSATDQSTRPPLSDEHNIFDCNEISAFSRVHDLRRLDKNHIIPGPGDSRDDGGAHPVRRNKEQTLADSEKQSHLDHPGPFLFSEPGVLDAWCRTLPGEPTLPLTPPDTDSEFDSSLPVFTRRFDASGIRSWADPLIDPR
jgi:hypothetical protein